jgi:hypothetical protein
MIEIELSKLIALFGGSSVIIIGLTTWISKIISKGLVENIKTSNQKEIELLKSELSTTREIAIRNSNAQFNLYTDLWNVLQDLKSVGDRLWERIIPEDLEFLSKLLTQAKFRVNRGRLILKGNHYSRLIIIFNSYDNYQIGKMRLFDLRTEQEWRENLSNYSENQIRQQIRDNKMNKDNFDKLLDELLIDFKSALGLQ